jgi:hypothetical protein
MRPCSTFVLILVFILPCLPAACRSADVPLFSVHEVVCQAAGTYQNPYLELEGEVVLSPPQGPKRRASLFWDGGATWKFRFSPDLPGEWTWRVGSADPGLEGQTGRFRAVASDRAGSIRPMRGHPHHFERQDGSPFWFMGDTAWALCTDHQVEKHDRAAVLVYLKTRADQGFNAVHCMLMSEAGWGNRGGPPFHQIDSGNINPGYWQEVDERLAEANRLGIICGLALAWGDKADEPYAWSKFPSLEARKRYARYIAARYAAYDVYFIVSGEWHAEVRARGSSPQAIREEFIELGHEILKEDPHGRMMAIHPMNGNGSAREFNSAAWMTFGDYQQNYYNLHERALESLGFDKPVVNSEYGYYLRDQDGNGVPDKENSTSLEIMRAATWDIVMAGAYAVTGFGTTYFGGHRDPGPFDLEAVKNAPWVAQIGHIKRVFTSLQWWNLKPHDELLSCKTPRGRDRQHLDRVAPPGVAYWCLADPGRQYLAYVRGLRSAPLEIALPTTSGAFTARQVNPRTGESVPLEVKAGAPIFSYTPPDSQDWVVVLIHP